MILRGLAYLGRDIAAAFDDMIAAGIVEAGQLATWATDPEFGIELGETEGVSE